MFTMRTVQGIGLNTSIEAVIRSAPLLAQISPVRHAAIWAGEQYIRFAGDGVILDITRPPGVMADRAEFGRAILHTADRAFARQLSPNTLRRLLENFVDGILMGGNRPAIDQFFKQNGTYPPGFLTLSPGKTCNLHCTGCYANAGPTAERLDWDTFNRIITEAKTLWGMRFLVISGGEPLAYHSDEKGILDAAEKHPDVFFMMYTNGTLIDDKVVKRMATLGNISPAFSLEGWRERTDERRGVGVFDKILTAMERLRLAGLPFGVSLTATRHNAEEILSDEFMDFLFEQQGALYGWLFHYMPIGRSFTLDLMPTPEQRLWMHGRVWEIIRQRHIFLADFWNHATISDGCVAGGHTTGGGYLYIDWNGTVAPCVFVPYSPVNINETYAKGGTLNDVWNNSFFADIRVWQKGYWNGKGNWLAPCLIRDHHAELRRLIAQHEPEPSDEEARQALLDPAYAYGMEEYDAAYQTLSESVWQKDYLQPKGCGGSCNRQLSEKEVSQNEHGHRNR